MKWLTFHFRSAPLDLLWISVLMLAKALFAQECIGCFPATPTASPVQRQLTAGEVIDPSSWTIRTRVDEVMVFFTATKGSKYVDTLAIEDITLTDDRKPPRRISLFLHQSELPLRVGLLLDASDSISRRLRFEQDSSSRFLRDILRPNKDLSFILAFNKQPILLQDFTSDFALLSESISLLRSGGETAVYDAIGAACQKLYGLHDDELAARVLIVLSDGEDNASALTLAQAIEAAQLAQITIYTISTNNRQVKESCLPLAHETQSLELLSRLVLTITFDGYSEVTTLPLRKSRQHL